MCQYAEVYDMFAVVDREGCSMPFFKRQNGKYERMKNTQQANN
jgi:hypothetical protein